MKDKAILLEFKALVIPPAWTDVEINTSPRAKIRATGYDVKGRKQYIYDAKYRQRQEQEKFDRIIRFAEKLEYMRRATGQHLRQRKFSREKVLAVMVRLLETAFFRAGNETYTKENKSYGLTTLRSRHLTIEKDELIFTYKGKSGQQQEKHIWDERLAKLVAAIDDLPGYEIFKYVDEADNVHDVKSNHLNEYIQEIMGAEFSAKDFRTWAGTVLAAIALDATGIDKTTSETRRKQHIREAIIAVSQKLGNTPAIARKSYIDPRIIDNYLQGKTLRSFKSAVDELLTKNENLSVEELGVLCLLQKKLGKRR